MSTIFRTYEGGKWHATRAQWRDHYRGGVGLYAWCGVATHLAGAPGDVFTLGEPGEAPEEPTCSRCASRIERVVPDPWIDGSLRALELLDEACFPADPDADALDLPDPEEEQPCDL